MRLAINAIMTRPGGALTVLVGLLKAWRALGCDLDITLLLGMPATLETIERLKLDCRLEAVIPEQATWRRAWWQQARLGRWLKHHRIDVLLTNNHYIPRLDCPQVVHHHNLWRFTTPDLAMPARRTLTDRVRDWSAEMALKRAAANVFVSDFLRKQAERFMADTRGCNYVIPNCLEDELVDAVVAPPPDIAPNQVIAVQNANAHKDNPTLIRTLAELNRIVPHVPWRLMIAGSSGRADWFYVRELAGRLNVERQIEWLGFLPSDQLAQIERRSLCLLATSRFESSGLTLIEAMAARAAVVATRIPAFQEYADDAAILVDAGEPRALAQAVVELYHSPSRRETLIEGGRARIENYRWSHWAGRFADIIKRAARGG